MLADCADVLDEYSSLQQEREGGSAPAKARCFAANSGASAFLAALPAFSARALSVATADRSSPGSSAASAKPCTHTRYLKDVPHN